MSDRRKEGKREKRGGERKKERERAEAERKRKRPREEKEGEAESLASTLPLLFASAADVVVRKGGKKISIKL